MLNPEEFKNKLEKIKKGTANSSSTAELEDEVYVIPEEYKGHYSGECGDCDYDTRMFEECEHFVRYLHYKEGSGIPPVVPEGYTYCGYMFSCCKNLTSLDLSHFDVSKVTDMSWMFSGCKNLTSLDLSNFDVSKVRDMSCMFSGCRSLTTLDLSHFDTLEVRDMSCMFGGCGSLTALELSNFNTSSVTDMSYMFGGCESLASVDLSRFDTSKVTDMSYMFYNCESLSSECKSRLKSQGFDVSIRKEDSLC